MSVDKFGTRLLIEWGGKLYEYKKNSVRCSSANCPFYPCGGAGSDKELRFLSRWCPARQMETNLQGRWVLLQ